MRSSDQTVVGANRSMVVICTKDRPDDIEMSCAAAHAASPALPLLVLDASTTDATRKVCEHLCKLHDPHLRLIYHPARRAGLARQRNDAIELCRELGVEIVHFIDDDTEVSPGYFDAIERRFERDVTVMGVGGVVVNQPVFDYLAIRSFFLLRSRRQGSGLRSGRKMLGQYPGAHESDHVEWLIGCSMSYRMVVFSEMKFDDRLEGASLGEDFDFSFRLSRKHRLAVEPEAQCVHHVTSAARDTKRATACERILNVYRRVSEQQDLGMSRAAFWWATFGDILLHTGSWLVLRKDGARDELRGMLDGVIDIARTSTPGLSSRQQRTT